MKRIKCAVMLLLCCLGAFAFAEQYAADYMYAKRYDISGRVVGTIAPDADGKSPFEYLATRNTYNSRSLLEKVESGVLTSFPSELVLVENWKDYGFTGTKITQTITYEYDEYGRTIKTTLLDNAGTAKTLTQVNYNTEGNIYCKARRMNPTLYSALPDACLQSSAGNYQSDANSQYGPDRISKFTYNEFDQVRTEMRGVDTPLVQTYVTNTYLPTSRVLLTQTDASGNVTTLAYDDWARLTKRTYPSKVVPGRSNDDDYNEYKYDPNGNIRYERKRNGAEINFIYDNNNRLSVKDYVVNTNQKDVYYDYDLRGLQTRAAFGTSVATAASVTADRNEQQYDGFGNVKKDLTSIGGVGRAVYGKYDLDNNRVKVTHDDNNYFTYQFDMLDRLGVIFENAGTRMLQIDYQQDGHRKRIYRRSGVSSTNYNFTYGIQLDSFTQDFKNDSYDLTNGFKYNAANQISELTLGNNLYYYKGNENRTGAYTVNGLNQYTYVGGATQGTGQPMGYDLNSNLVNDGSLIYKYDDENRLIETSGSAASKFIYDPRGRLFESTINGTKTQFLYDGIALVAEYDGSGVMQRRYVHGDQTDEPLVQYNGNTFGNSAAWRYLHADHQGSIIAQSDVNGNVFSTLSYDTYGIPRTTSIDNSDRFGYTGQIWFKDLGLWYYKARVYHPKLGRFLQTDPVGYKDDYNLYAYVGNDPLNKNDPTGLEAEFWKEFGDGWAYAGESTSGQTTIDPTNRQGSGFATGYATATAIMNSGSQMRSGALRGNNPTSSSKPSQNQCFEAGTLVQTVEGDQSIESIKIGDLVYSENPETNEKAIKPVSRLFKNKHVIYEVLVVTEDGHQEKVNTTKNHPFYVVGRGWVKAKHLIADDIIESNKSNRIKFLSGKSTHRITATYNFEVADFHTYFVSSFGLLVHNACTYQVPGDRTASGKPYVGMTSKDSPEKRPGNGADGRERRAEDKQTDMGNASTKELKVQEQTEMNAAGGVDKLDNKINSIKPEDWEKYGIPPPK